MKHLFTVNEAAKLLDYEPGHLRNLMSQGKITAIKVGTYYVRITDKELKRLLERKNRLTIRPKKPLEQPINARIENTNGTVDNLEENH